MKGLILLIFAAGLYFLLFFKRKSDKNIIFLNVRKKENEKGAYNTRKASDYHEVETTNSSNNDIPNSGDIIKRGNNEWVMNPLSYLLLTIRSDNSKVVKEIKKLLDEGYHQSPWETIDKLSKIIIQNNITCKEVEEYINKYKLLYKEAIRNLRDSSPEWSTAGEKDKADLEVEFKNKAISSLDITPSSIDDLVVLFECDNCNVEMLRTLIEKYGFENLRFYLKHVNNTDKIFKINANHRDRGLFEKLTELGLARRGQKIQPEKVLKLLKMTELNELGSNYSRTKFSKKSKAIESISAIPNIHDKVGKYISLRELFQIQPLIDHFPRANVNELSQSLNYIHQAATLIAVTYNRAQYEIRERHSYKGSTMIKSCSIQVNSECKYCKSYAHKEFTTSNIPKIPLHIGCTCYIIPNMVDDDKLDIAIEKDVKQIF